METEKTENGILEHWTPEEVRTAFERDEIILIDVRTPQEFNVERIGGALLAPMQAFQPNHMPSQADKRIVFHCGSGVRSGKVATQCLRSGVDRIAHMTGGLGAWKEAGFEYTGTDMATGAPKTMSQATGKD
ncbi:rhodanese-like domain-containing protein [Jannaschia donghaensis]|uniref:Putative adenylyltransferase/sulfurtransferase MoeZ n=1 Tax=Jannaschia donghaensis TaxID=420998 RepID=A0A0M6YJ80_9RHOB|nr:rhodanese-like domain-containing protein [Jannaschia donghaensis]CTQ49126.1 putative adenylyltransferase/sulfurtransferase MoeZ [Jannaschia donghaensis]